MVFCYICRMKDVLFWIGCILFFAGVFMSIGAFLLTVLFDIPFKKNETKDIKDFLADIEYTLLTFMLLSVGAYLIINTM